MNQNIMERNVRGKFIMNESDRLTEFSRKAREQIMQEQINSNLNRKVLASSTQRTNNPSAVHRTATTTQINENTGVKQRIREQLVETNSIRSVCVRVSYFVMKDSS